MRLGHNVQIVSLCDYQAISFTNENQIVEGTAIIVNRIPVSLRMINVLFGYKMF